MKKFGNTVQVVDLEDRRNKKSTAEQACDLSLEAFALAIEKVLEAEQRTEAKIEDLLTLLRDATQLEAVAVMAPSGDGQRTSDRTFFSTDERVCSRSFFAGAAKTDGSVCSGMQDAERWPLRFPNRVSKIHFFWLSDHDRKIETAGLLAGFARCDDGLSHTEIQACNAIMSPLCTLLDTVTADRQLVDANNRFESLTNSLPGVVYQRVVRPDGDIRYTYISETAKDIFGISAREILDNPKSLFDIYAPQYREKFRDRLIEASKAMTKWDVEASIIQPDGSIRYTHAIALPRKLADGSVLWTGVILDASRIKKAEQEAAEAEERTKHAIVESLGQGFVMFDKSAGLILKNSAFDELFAATGLETREGQTYENFIFDELGAAFPELIGGKQLTGMRNERLEQHRSGKPFSCEYRLGGESWLQINEHRTADGRTVITYTDVTALKEREAEIQHLAMHDVLTGLPNRTLFRDRSQQALSDARRYGLKTAILALDLDNFKIVNDTFGHPTGDRLLCEVTNRVRSCVRETDTLARLGGDEFAIIMRDVDDPLQVERIAKRIIQALSVPVDLGGHSTDIGISIGVAFCDGETLDQDDLLKNADLALYRAKADGKNTYRFFDKSMDELTRARRRLETDLRHALNEEHLQLHFQPQINVGKKEITGFEALARWHHPERGSISPTDFITIAEESGLIHQLGEWVLFKACNCAAKWSKPLKVAVNLSAAQFARTDIVEMVDRALKESGLCPTRLELEITESLLLHNTKDVIETLYRLKGLGIQIAMDDFGTGYSSLGNLRSFPFDRIKIDKSFVLNLETDPEALAIIKAVVGLSRSLGMATTAEGVETMYQLSHLSHEGCTDIQGFYYSSARPPEEVENLISQGVENIAALGLSVTSDVELV